MISLIIDGETDQQYKINGDLNNMWDCVVDQIYKEPISVFASGTKVSTIQNIYQHSHAKDVPKDIVAKIKYFLTDDYFT